MSLGNFGLGATKFRSIDALFAMTDGNRYSPGYGEFR